MGTGQFLASRHIPHTFILDDAITSQDISRFRVLLAPGMDCISDAQESILKQFIFNGGTLLLTGESGVLTPYGEVRDKRAFCDILTERLLAETTKTDLMEVKYGKGRIIYSMDKSMMNEFCPSIRDTDMIYRFTPPDPKITAFNERIIENTVGTMKFKSISIPSKVLVTAYKDTEKGAVMVHLLNATGVKSKHGDVLPPLAAPAWEPINEDISFEITLPSFKKAIILRPMRKDTKKVDVEKNRKEPLQSYCAQRHSG